MLWIRAQGGKLWFFMARKHSRISWSWYLIEQFGLVFLILIKNRILKKRKTGTEVENIFSSVKSASPQQHVAKMPSFSSWACLRTGVGKALLSQIRSLQSSAISAPVPETVSLIERWNLFFSTMHLISLLYWFWTPKPPYWIYQFGLSLAWGLLYLAPSPLLDVSNKIFLI